MRSPKKIAYILDLFPVLSETFIVREILELKKQQINVLIFARVSTSGLSYSEVVHKDTDDLLKEVRYLPELLKDTKLKRWSLLLLLHIYFLLSSPRRYLATFYYSLKQGNKLFITFIFSVACVRELIIERVNHMHVHFALRACTLAMIISKLTGISYSFTVHAHDIFINDLAELMEDKLNNAKFVVCISEYNKQYVLNKYPSVVQDKIKIIHCGLDMSDFNHSSKVRNDKFTILSIGRLVEHKGFKYLIEACKRVKEETNVDFICNIIGEGKERQHLEELISVYGLTDVVRLSGAMEQADVRKALEKADVFILPCATEQNGMQDGIPVVLMEAMAMGIPVISTFVSGVPELVRDGAGILVQQKDPDGLSKAMMEIISMKDEDREIMGRRGRAIVEEYFNIQNEVHKLADIIAA